MAIGMRAESMGYVQKSDVALDGVRRLERDLEEARAEAAELRTQLADARRELADARRELAASRITELDAAVRAKDAQIAALTAELAEVKGDLGLVKGRLAVLEADKEAIIFRQWLRLAHTRIMERVSGLRLWELREHGVFSLPDLKRKQAKIGGRTTENMAALLAATSPALPNVIFDLADQANAIAHPDDGYRRFTEPQFRHMATVAGVPDADAAMLWEANQFVDRRL
jgi:hypothetical protein